MRLFCTLIIFLFTLSCNQHESRFQLIDSFESEYIKARNITVFLPVSYFSSDLDYPVLYMHDGQMLFDSTTTWNGQEWGVDEVLDQLIKENKIEEPIIIAIDNGGPTLRHPEYFPQKPFESLSQATQDSLYQLNRDSNSPLFANSVQSNSYLKFIAEELKPHIDKNYRTKASAANTFIAGSSMGGLISMYAICEYPNVFGGAACLSTHWPGVFTTENNPIPQAFFDYLNTNLPDPSSHKLYFDYGTETLDALYESYQIIADSIIRSNGYDDSNLMTRKFEGHKHDERSWKSRLHIPFTYLLSEK